MGTFPETRGHQGEVKEIITRFPLWDTDHSHLHLIPVAFLPTNMMLILILLACAALVTAVPSPADLQPLLSDAAEVYFPGSEGFANATYRWSAAVRPHFDVIVKVKTEEDVRQTVCCLFSNPRFTLAPILTARDSIRQQIQTPFPHHLRNPWTGINLEYCTQRCWYLDARHE